MKRKNEQRKAAKAIEYVAYVLSTRIRYASPAQLKAMGKIIHQRNQSAWRKGLPLPVRGLMPAA